MTVVAVCVCVCAERPLSPEAPYETQGVNVTVIEGKTALLPCSVRDAFIASNNKPIKVVWTDQWSTILTFEGNTIIDDERIHVDHTLGREWNLRVDRVKHGDQGIYTCQINTEPVISYTVHLTVVVPPRLINDGLGGKLEVEEGSKAELVCNATGIPAPTITWFRKGLELGERRERIGEAGQVLVIHNVTRYCGGIYECVAENGVPPSVRKDIRVQVKFQPEISLATRRLSQMRDKDTILECMVSAHPQGQAFWRFRGQHITNSQKYTVNIYPQVGTDLITLSLTIRHLEADDFGKYSCIASNSLGSSSKKMTLSELVVRTRPTTTQTTTTTTITSSSITTTAASAPTGARWSTPHPQGLKPGAPQADRRVHNQGGRGGGGAEKGVKSWAPHGRPRQDDISQEQGAKSGRISASSCGPQTSVLAAGVVCVVVRFWMSL
ncbi:hypothetical protein ACOMHN_064527 [Nucella lapillus]